MGAAAARRSARSAGSGGGQAPGGLARTHRFKRGLRPVGQVLQDPPLLELAKRHPRQIEALGQIRGIHPSFIKRRAAELLEAISAGLEDPPIPREGKRGHSDSSDAPLIALAEALLRARAMDAGLAYELIASRSDLEQIITAARQSGPEPDVRTLTGWRRELVGSDLEVAAVGPRRRGGRRRPPARAASARAQRRVRPRGLGRTLMLQ